MWGLSGDKGYIPLAGHLQDLDFCIFLVQGIGHDLYDPYFLVSFSYSVIYLLITLGLSRLL